MTLTASLSRTTSVNSSFKNVLPLFCTLQTQGTSVSKDLRLTYPNLPSNFYPNTNHTVFSIYWVARRITCIWYMTFFNVYLTDLDSSALYSTRFFLFRVRRFYMTQRFSSGLSCKKTALKWMKEQITSNQKSPFTHKSITFSWYFALNMCSTENVLGKGKTPLKISCLISWVLISIQDHCSRAAGEGQDCWPVVVKSKGYFQYDSILETRWEHGMTVLHSNCSH